MGCADSDGMEILWKWFTIYRIPLYLVEMKQKYYNYVYLSCST